MSERQPDPHPKARVCVLCGKPQDARFKPFCSQRCADIDLGRWLKGGYAIPAGPSDETETPDRSAGEGEE
ncbi:MAG: DNA gyrase inhibitor YacG [Rhizomicrobium sp.]|jgi:hypothetical protein